MLGTVGIEGCMKVSKVGVTVAVETRSAYHKSIYVILRNRQVSANELEVACDWSC